MNRDDWLCLGVRGLGLFFLARAILLVPTLINTYRMQDLLLGPDAREKYDAGFLELMGTSAVAMCLGVFALASAVLFMVPCGRRTG